MNAPAAEFLSNTRMNNESQTAEPVVRRIMSERKYNMSGCLNLVSTVMQPKEHVNLDVPVSLSSSWLPLSMSRLPDNQATRFRCAGLISAISDRSYRRMAPQIDAYAVERGWVVQPVNYFYRPHGFDVIAGPDSKIKDVAFALRQLNTAERPMIDTTHQTENQTILLDLLNLCCKVLEQASIAEPAYMRQTDHPRALLNELLADLPFLVHHIFAHLPNLSVLKHRARINGREDIIYHIRYEPEAVKDFNNDRLMRPKVINVVA